MSLLEKYRPRRIADFIGLQRPKKILSTLATRPAARALLFTGKPGTGKTAMAQAFALEIGAELHLLPASQLTRESVAKTWERCQYGQRNLILIDNADALSRPHQIDLRSKLDGLEGDHDTIWVFTATEELEAGLSSRCLHVPFSTYGMAAEAAKFIESVWDAEASPTLPRPNFTRIVKEANGSIRVALNELQRRL